MTGTVDRRALLAMGAALAAFGLGATGAAHAAPAPYRWTQLPWGGGGFVDGFAYHPTEKGLLYARTDVGGLYRFDPAGRRWLPLLDALGKDQSDLMGILSVALDPHNPDRVYVAAGEYLGAWAQDGGVLASDDRGATWRTTMLGLKLGGNSAGRGTGERLQVDPNHGDILFLGTNQNGLLKSGDRARTFGVTAAPVKNVTLVLFDETSGSAGAATPVIYVGSADDKGRLLKSSDGGATFAPVPGLPKMIPQRAILDAAGTLYVTFSDGLTPWGGANGAVWKLTPDGKAHDISPMKPGGGNPTFAWCGLDIARSTPGTLVVSTMNRWALHDDIYLSRDGGAHWKAIGPQARHDPTGYPWLVTYLKGEDHMGHWIADVKIDPHDANGLIYGTGYGLWLTNDLGNIDGASDVHFAFAVTGLEETVSTAMLSPSGGATLFAGFGDVSGGAYDDLTQGPQAGVFAPASETTRSVSCAELNPLIVARTADQARTGGYLSQDGGATWTPFATTPRTEKDAKGEYNQAGVVTVSSDGASLVWVPQKQGAYVSLDLGKTWTASRGWPAGRQGMSAVADPVVGNVFFALDRDGRQVLNSTDGGVSFAPVLSGLPEVAGYQTAQLLVAPGRLSDLWLAMPSGLYRSFDLKASKAVSGVDEAWKVALGKAAAGKDYPAVYVYGKVRGVTGLWRSDDAGGAWVRIDDDAHRFGRLNHIAADPLEYGTVYVGPEGRGVLVGRIA